MDLLERDGDLGMLRDRWLRARDGRGGLVMVRGEAGAGKTSVLQGFTESIADGTPVLWGACDPLSTPRPLGPIHDLADRLGDETASLLRDAQQPHEIYAAVFEELRLNPAVLVIDDLHWADQGTIDLLRFLLRRIRVTRTLIVGAMRDDEVGARHPLRSLLGDAARSPDAVETTLAPLSVAAVASLVGDRELDPTRLHGITAGNAFFVTEMLSHGGSDLPRTVRDAILARTTELDEHAWDLLHLLACTPEAIPDRLLAPLAVGLEPLRALDDAGLIRRSSRGVSFRHDLCRITIAETLPPGGEARLHRRVLDALDGTPLVDHAVLAHHAVGAGDTARTLEHATAAGRAAARSGAHTQAARFFELALEHGHPAPQAEAGLLELLADEYYLIDDLHDAIAASQRAMTLRATAADHVGVSSNHHALSVFHWYNGNRPLAEEHATNAEIALTQAGVPETIDERVQLGRAYAMQAYLALQSNDLRRMRALVARAAALLDGVDDPMLTVRLRILDAIGLVHDGADGSRAATLSILAAARDDFDEIYSSGYSNLTYLDVEHRRFRQANELLGFSLPLTVERDLPICRVWQLGSRARLKLMEGRWAEALLDAETVLDEPSAPLARTWPLLIRGLVTLRRGGDASHDLDAAWALACSYDEPIRTLPAAAALAEQVWVTGQPDGRLDDCGALLRRNRHPGLGWARGDLAVWLQRLGIDPAIDEVDDLAPPHRRHLSGDAIGAAAEWRTLAAPYDEAMASIDAGGDEDTRHGLDLLDRLGADEAAAKVRQDLRRRGATAVPARRRETTRANPAGLTNRQVDILRLLVDRSTNAEIAQKLFLSPKTVDHHVSALLAKLQVASRHDAVERARSLGVDV